jgi:hypothetical protein
VHHDATSSLYRVCSLAGFILKHRSPNHRLDVNDDKGRRRGWVGPVGARLASRPMCYTQGKPCAHELTHAYPRSGRRHLGPEQVELGAIFSFLGPRSLSDVVIFDRMPRPWLIPNLLHVDILHSTGQNLWARIG